MITEQFNENNLSLDNLIFENQFTDLSEIIPYRHTLSTLKLLIQLSI